MTTPAVVHCYGQLAVEVDLVAVNSVVEVLTFTVLLGKYMLVVWLDLYCNNCTGAFISPTKNSRPLALLDHHQHGNQKQYRRHQALIEELVSVNNKLMKVVRLIKTRDPSSALESLKPATARAVHHNSLKTTAFAWNTMISSSPAAALRFFIHMRRRGVPPDLYTFPLLLKACSCSPSTSVHGRAVHGRAAHALALKHGLAADLYVANTLVRFYGALGHADRALQVFDEMPHRDAVSWSAVIACLASAGHPKPALSAFRAMQTSCSSYSAPDAVTMLSVVTAAAAVGALDLAVWVHCYLVRNGFHLTAKLGTALVVMFSNSGAMDLAAWVFDAMPERNARTWTALIKAYARHGRSSEALGAFGRMEAAGFRPDHVTLIAVLMACSHGGLVDQGWRVFDSIRSVYGMEPTADHYGCMVDLMARSGQLEEAYRFIMQIPIEANSVIWRTLLGACVRYGDVELANKVKERIAELEEPGHDGDYVLLSNVYGGLGRWEEKDEVRRVMREEGIAKRPGCSSLEL